MGLKIAICGSMVFTEQMLEARSQLKKLGHDAFVSDFSESYIGKNEQEIEGLVVFHKNERDAIREY